MRPPVMNSFACALLYMLVFASRVLSKTKYLASMFQWLQFRHHAGWAKLHEISNTLRIILYRVHTSFRKGIHIQMQCRSDTEEVGRSLAVARSKSQPSSRKHVQPLSAAISRCWRCIMAARRWKKCTLQGSKPAPSRMLFS
ncbi:hypothetical protein M405DRAFT_92593 [Rhizopogon salebrosus TDB-379]|nr:hypothetical protein M405DRAFT_92593 [Rhizopogon salebrosus TDB-379]